MSLAYRHQDILPFIAPCPCTPAVPAGEADQDNGR
jgi:hypothetical protein